MKTMAALLLIVTAAFAAFAENTICGYQSFSR